MTTVTSQRYRSTLKTFRESSVVDAETAYNAYEVTEAADTTKTKQTRITGSGWDGEMYFIFAETTYPEIADSPLDQVPPL